MSDVTIYTDVAEPVSVPSPSSVTERTLQSFVEREVSLLDGRRFEEWVDLFTDDGAYWVPAQPGQTDPLSHVSLFYDDKQTMLIRVQRLRHPQMHCQDPASATVRLVSNFTFGEPDIERQEWRVTSKFIMLEDRPETDRRLFGGTYHHRLRMSPEGLKIVEKRVELTNAGARFPSLSQPF